MKLDFPRELPALITPWPGCFNPDAAAVQQWLDSLPALKRGETAKALYDALGELNTMDIPARKRYQTLNLLEGPVRELLDELEGHYAGYSLPLADKRLQVARLAGQLSARMATSYRLVLAHLKLGSLMGRRGRRELRSQAVDSLFDYLARLHTVYDWLGLPVAEGFWQVAHDTYHREEQEALAHGQSLGVMSYRRLLLTALAPVQQMSARDVRSLREALKEWAHFAHVLKGAGSGGEHEPFCVQLDADMAPAMTDAQYIERCRAGRHMRQLDTAKLLKHLQSLLGTEGEVLLLASGQQVNRRLISLLLEQWHGVRGRHGQRFGGDGVLEMVAGLSTLHHLMAIKEGVEESVELATDMGLGANAVLTGFDGVELKLGEHDLWDAVYPGRYNEQQPWVDAFRDEVDTTTSFVQVINQDRGGYQLMASEDEIQPLKSGMVVGLRDDKKAHWQAAAIRWVRETDEGDLVFGVARLFDVAEAALLQIPVKDGEEDVVLPAIIGRFREAEPAAIIPSLSGMQQREPVLTIGELHHRLDLSRALDEQIGYSVLPISNEAPPSRDVEEISPQEASPDEASVAEQEEDEFSGLWGRL